MSPEEPVGIEPPRIPGYRVIAPVGVGSRGVVYRARDLDTEDLVAVKVFAPSGRPDADAACERLARAVSGMRGLRAEAILGPRGAFVVDDPPRLVVVTDYVDGDSLARVFQRSIRLGPARAAGVAAAVARGLGEAASKGLVHGALHPGKVILGARGRAQAGADTFVIGLGLGETLPAAFEDPLVSGRASPHIYASDEVLAGGAPTAASDVFSLGAILFHVLTGRAPYRADSLSALRLERADGPLIWPRAAAAEIPLGLVRLVDRMTSSLPGVRPAPGAPLADEIVRASQGRSERLAPAPRMEPTADIAPLAAPSGGPGHESPDGAFERVVSAARAVRRKPSALRALTGAAVALLLAAIAFVLRPSGLAGPAPAGEDAAATPAARGATDRAAPEAVVGRAVAEEPPAPAPQAPPDPAMEELRAIAGRLAAPSGADGSDRDASLARLKELAGRGDEVGAEASRLLSDMTRRHGDEAETALRPLLDRASDLEAAGRYGAAIAVLAEFPSDRYAGTPADRRARLEADAIRGRAAAAFGEVEARATAFLAAGDYDAARSEYAAAAQAIGLPMYAANAERAIDEIGRAEEEAAAVAAAQRAAEDKKALHEEVARAVARVAADCRAFRYSDAERALGEIMAKPLSPEDLAGVAAYADLVRREIGQFRRVRGRIRSGELVSELLFRMDLDVQFDLESGYLSERLRGAFQAHGILLTAGASIAQEREGDLWRIDDAAAGRSYFVERSAEALNVCSDETPYLCFGKSPASLVISDITEEGLVLTARPGTGALSTRFSWARLPDAQAMNLMGKIGGNPLSVEEQLALAVFAHHRGLDADRENALRVAERLARSRRSADDRALVGRVRQALESIKIER